MKAILVAIALGLTACALPQKDLAPEAIQDLQGHKVSDVCPAREGQRRCGLISLHIRPPRTPDQGTKLVQRFSARYPWSTLSEIHDYCQRNKQKCGVIMDLEMMFLESHNRNLELAIVEIRKAPEKMRGTGYVAVEEVSGLE
jgi:hypothetical protein